MFERARIHGYPHYRTGFSLGTLTEAFDSIVGPITGALNKSILVTVKAMKSTVLIILRDDRYNIEFVYFV